MNRWLVFILVGIIALQALALGGLEILFRWRVLPNLEKNLDTQAKHLSLFLEDQTFLSRFEIMKPAASGRSGAGSDAGSVLNKRLHWAPIQQETLQNFQNPKRIVANEDRESILRLRHLWMKRHFKAKKIKADLSFFDELERFDHWNIEANSPIEILIQTNRFSPPPLLPIPEVSDLLTATQLRLMRGASSDSLLALKQVRQLARLLISTENMQLVLAGLTVLDHERRAYRYFVDEKGFAPELWTPIDRNTTRRAHRAIQATSGYLRLWTPEQTFASLFLGKPNELSLIGLCAAANDTYPLEFALRPLLEPQWPLERDFRANYERLDSALQLIRARCRLKYLNHLVQIDNFETEVPGPFFLTRLPYSRKVFGLQLSVLNFNGFADYGILAVQTSPPTNGN